MAFAPSPTSRTVPPASSRAAATSTEPSNRPSGRTRVGTRPSFGHSRRRDRVRRPLRTAPVLRFDVPPRAAGVLRLRPTVAGCRRSPGAAAARTQAPAPSCRTTSWFAPPVPRSRRTPRVRSVRRGVRSGPAGHRGQTDRLRGAPRCLQRAMRLFDDDPLGTARRTPELQESRQPSSRLRDRRHKTGTRCRTAAREGRSSPSSCRHLRARHEEDALVPREANVSTSLGLPNHEVVPCEPVRHPRRRASAALNDRRRGATWRQHGSFWTELPEQ
jgi:hypothetical protein